VRKTRAKTELKPSASLPLETSFGYLVREIHRMQARLLQDDLATHGVSGGCWYFLRVLWNEDALTQRELSVRTGVNEATARIAVDRMETEKLVVREQDRHDRRKWIVRLTMRGRNLEPELISLAVKLNIQAMGCARSIKT
jgi:DNA-binding MarR family transcriptional regulator